MKTLHSFYRTVQTKLLGKISSNLDEICTYLCLLHETNCKNIYAKKNNAKLKNTTKMVKLSPKILVRSYSFADIMTLDKYVAFKIVSCCRKGNFL